MLDEAARMPGETAPPGLHMGHVPGDGDGSRLDQGSGEAPRRRVTADSFRALSARLKKQPFTPSVAETAAPQIVIPDIIAEVKEAAVTHAIPAIEPVAGAAAMDVEQAAALEVIEDALEASPPNEPEPHVYFEPALTVDPDPIFASVFPPRVSEPFEQVEAEDHRAAGQVESVEAEPVVEQLAPSIEEATSPSEVPAEPVKLTLAELTRLVYSEPSDTDQALYRRELAEILSEEANRAVATIEAAPVVEEEATTQQWFVVEEAAAEPEVLLDEVPVSDAVQADAATEPVYQATEAEAVEYELPEKGIEEPVELAAVDSTPLEQTVFAEFPAPEEPAEEPVEIEPALEIQATAVEIEPQQAAVVEEEPVAEVQSPSLADVLSDRLGPNAQLLRKADEPDPFSQQALAPVVQAEVEELPAEEAGDLARSLLDMMSSSAGAGLPQERALAADTLLRMVPRMPLKALVAVVDRISLMSHPPELLVARLIRDPRFEVAGPLLERCNNISDQDLSSVIQEGDAAKQRMIARRRVLSSSLSDQLIEFRETSVLLTLVRNAGASLSHDAFNKLAEHAAGHASLLAPLSTRADLPAPVAFELFWLVPPELRRYLLSRFLTDSETLNKILKITMAMQGGEEMAEAKFPERSRIDAVVEHAAAGRMEDAAVNLAEIGGISPENAMRILSDRDGEPLAIVMKALGTGRARFAEILATLKRSDHATLSPNRENSELQNIFDSMSFNKARILLTYWDWAVQKSGPYAASN
jgi:uncharacterized protein (DUF2336 family)